MILEHITKENLNFLTKLSIELWNDSTYYDKVKNWNRLLNLNACFCLLAKIDHEYVGFIHVSIRKDYVEGSDFLTVGYIEAFVL